MKTLHQHINEWRANTNTVSSIKTQYFIYKLTKIKLIKIFDKDWEQLNYYRDKVYINGENVGISDIGYTIKEYKPGTYKVEIKDINEVIDCSYMFFECETLISVPLFDTSKVKNMYSMFNSCSNLKNVSLFNTCNVKDMSRMFENCYELENVPNFNTKNVEDMYRMFYYCKNLKEVPLFDTKNVENMDSMFHGCKNIKNVPLFNIKNVETMEDMFYVCYNLSGETVQEWSQIYDFKFHSKL